MTATGSRAFRVLGTTDDVTTCELCGNDELKGTIVLQPLDAEENDDGEPVYYGSSCGARAAGWTVGGIRAAAKAADRRAAVERYYQRATARQILTVFGPVENAELRERSRAWLAHPELRPRMPVVTVTEDIKTMLAEARALLGETPEAKEIAR